MTAKEYLGQAYWLDRRIDSKLEQLSALRETTTKATSVMNDTPVSHTRNMHSLQDVIAKIIDMENELNHDIDALVDLKKDIKRCIDAVENPEYKTLLELRYLTFKNWNEIAIIMSYEGRYVYKVHGAALKQVDQILSEGH
ncbi:MAG: DUF1492 domain-containing protein [Clostridia bacterium]|nr:DUF1492 domain-containing protein [Clostridia bacterium]